MSDALQVFNFEEHGVRVIIRDNEPWFVAKDICDILELENVTKALYGLDEDEVVLQKVRAGIQDREMNTMDIFGN